MSTLALPRGFECAPHAARSSALAITLALNLAIVVYALLPSTPYPVRTPPPRSIAATVLPPPPPAVAPPQLPVARAAPRIAVPTPRVTLATPMSLHVATIPAVITAITSALPVATPVASGAAADSSASVAYASATAPDYPILAARARIEGTVLLKVLVAASGVPLAVEVEQSSGSRLLDNAARRHVLAAWRFHPAMRGGHAVQSWALVPVRFKLENR